MSILRQLPISDSVKGKLPDIVLGMFVRSGDDDGGVDKKNDKILEDKKTGSRINVRPYSSDKRPTLEIQKPISKAKIKIRYNDSGQDK